jgi:nitrogen regulatory protein PII 2
MKEVMTVIRMNKINETKQALVKAGIPSFTARKVLGRGKGQVDFKVLKGAQEGHPEAIALLGQPPRLIPKRLLTVVVPDDKVPTAVKTIIRVNQTGNAGDGKIFVLPISDAIRIRTAESAEIAIDEMSI